jgi:hypothetical protein
MNFSSFAGLTKATKDATPPQQVAFAPPKASGSFSVGAGSSSAAAPQHIAFAPSKAPGSFGVGSSAATQPLNFAPSKAPGTFQSPQVLGLLMYINDNILDFQDNVKGLLKEGKISLTRRKDIEEVLKAMLSQVPLRP